MKKTIMAALFAVFALTGVAYAAQACCEGNMPCCDPPAECCD